MTAPEEFFVGWSRGVGPRLGRFLLMVGAGMLGGAGLLALALGAAADDPAGPNFASAPGAAATAPTGEAALVGLLTLTPYPLLHLPSDAAHPRGRAVLLAEDGKRGASVESSLAGHSVAVKGFLLGRGDIEMLVLDRPPVPVAAMPITVPVEPLGRWLLGAGDGGGGGGIAGVAGGGRGLHPGRGRRGAVLHPDDGDGQPYRLLFLRARRRWW